MNRVVPVVVKTIAALGVAALLVAWVVGSVRGYRETADLPGTDTVGCVGANRGAEECGDDREIPDRDDGFDPELDRIIDDAYREQELERAYNECLETGTVDECQAAFFGD